MSFKHFVCVQTVFTYFTSKLWTVIDILTHSDSLCCKSGTEYKQFYDYLKNNTKEHNWYVTMAVRRVHILHPTAT